MEPAVGAARDVAGSAARSTYVDAALAGFRRNDNL